MTSPTAYEILRDYVDDLGTRISQKVEWAKRHPDHTTEQYQLDECGYYDADPGSAPRSFMSTFDPDDPSPQVSDIITHERFFALMNIALEAYETAELVKKKVL